MVALLNNWDTGLAWKCVFCKRKEEKRARQQSSGITPVRVGYKDSGPRGLNVTPIPGPGPSTSQSLALKNRVTPEVIVLSDDEVEEISILNKEKRTNSTGKEPAEEPVLSRSSSQRSKSVF